jgi:microcystin-dependent protein
MLEARLVHVETGRIEQHARRRRLFAEARTPSPRLAASTIRACGVPDAIRAINSTGGLDAVVIEEPHGAIALDAGGGQTRMARVQAVAHDLDTNAGLLAVLSATLSPEQVAGASALSQAIVSASAITAPNIAVLAGAVAELSESVTELEAQAVADRTLGASARDSQANATRERFEALHTTIEEATASWGVALLETSAHLATSIAAISGDLQSARRNATAGTARLWNETAGIRSEAAHLAAIPGEIRSFSGPYSSLPRGWLPADGRCLSVEEAPSLFAAVGLTWTLPEEHRYGCSAGARSLGSCDSGGVFEGPGGMECGASRGEDCGDAAGVLPAHARERMFCLPDLRSRSMEGAWEDAGGKVCTGGCNSEAAMSATSVFPSPSPGMTLRKAGATHGSEETRLKVEHLPAHTHRASVSRNYVFSVSSSTVETDSDCGTFDTCGGFVKSVSSTSSTPSVTIDGTGGDQPFAIVPPRAAVTVAVFAGQDVQVGQAAGTASASSQV